MGNSVTSNYFQLSLRHLATRPIEECDEEFWSRFTEGTFTPDQVKTLLNTTELETIRGLQPKNFKLLVLKLVWKIQSVLQTANLTKTNIDQAMTCVYILTRLAPIALQNPSSGFSDYVFWSPDVDYGMVNLLSSSQIQSTHKHLQKLSLIPYQVLSQEMSPSWNLFYPRAILKVACNHSLLLILIQKKTLVRESVKLSLKSQMRKVKKLMESTHEAAPSNTEPLIAEKVEEVKEEISYGPIGTTLMDCLLKMLFTPHISLAAEPEFKSDTNGTT